MTMLIFGIAVFVAIHLVPAFVPLRQGLVQMIGLGLYKGMFAAVAFLGLILLIVGKANADYMPVWTPPVWARHISLAVMPFALMLLAGSHMPSNVKRVTAHPMLWGVTLWAAVHLLANGDLASILLFGGFGVYSLFAMWSANRRGAKPSDMHYSLAKDLTVVGVGLATYCVLLFLHPYLFGASPLG